jgi:hypothetical protein
MTISTLKDLEKLIKLCRRTGVDSITVDGVILNLGEEPIIEKRHKSVLSENPHTGSSVADFIDAPDELTPEQLLYYSSQGFIPTDEII